MQGPVGFSADAQSPTRRLNPNTPEGLTDLLDPDLASKAHLPLSPIASDSHRLSTPLLLLHMVMDSLFVFSRITVAVTCS